MFVLENDLPKISCLMVTANGRLEYFKRSINCYLDQTYPNKELIIVNEGSKDYQNEIFNYLKDKKDIRFIFLDGWYSLGALRNISIALSFGDIFVQWDDDDFNMPDRLAIQYSYLSKHPKAEICYLTEQLHYYFDKNTIFWEDWKNYCSAGLKRFSLIPGTIMAWRKNFHFRYPAVGQHCSAGEDSVLSNELCEKIDEKIILLSNFGHMQIYTYHGKNTFDVEHHMNISRYRSLSCDKIIKNRSQICDTLKYMKLNKKIKVMGREGLAFIYED